MRMASQIFVLFTICIAHIYAVPITCRLQRTLMENSHSLLESMGGRFPLECLQHNVPIEFPTNSFQTDDATKSIGAEMAIYKTLKFIDTLFENNSPPSTWNGQNVDVFQNIIYRQIEDSECIMTKSGTPQDDFSQREAALRMYFAQLTTLKDSGDCGWEVIRKELLHTFNFITHSKLLLK